MRLREFIHIHNPAAASRAAKRIREGIILDSFSGSGTTAHAILALNKNDGGNRKFILVEMEDYADTITAESLPDYGALAHYVFYTATGKSLDGEVKEKPDFYVGETDLYEIYLIYTPDVAFLRGNDSALNDIKLKAIAARNSKKEKLVFATAKYMGQKELSAQNITFCQLPYSIHKVVGA